VDDRAQDRVDTQLGRGIVLRHTFLYPRLICQLYCLNVHAGLRNQAPRLPLHDIFRQKTSHFLYPGIHAVM